jgi:hypothetical protein
MCLASEERIKWNNIDDPKHDQVHYLNEKQRAYALDVSSYLSENYSYYCTSVKVR